MCWYGYFSVITVAVGYIHNSRYIQYVVVVVINFIVINYELNIRQSFILAGAIPLAISLDAYSTLEVLIDDISLTQFDFCFALEICKLHAYIYTYVYI